MQVFRKTVAGSRFEDIIFWSDLCSSESLNGVLCGSNYNRSWIIHNTVSEAFQQMLFLQFIGEQLCGLSDGLAEICADPELYISSAETQYYKFACKYADFRQSIKERKFGKTLQFWIKHLDLMQNQNMIHLGVKENDFDY